ncbi:MAG: M20/M25/M40 family metallo-hydrolase [Bacteroidia bacterium]|nr:M20/M25/M40 family metallo-hydrolase [Bacteroidia bacterium]
MIHHKNFCRLFLVSFYLLIAIPVFAQNQKNIDSLKNVLNSSASDSIKLDALHRLCNSHSGSAPLKALFYGKKCIDLAEKTNNKKGLCSCYINIGYVYEDLRGKNAIYTAARAALEIEKLNERLNYDDFLGKGTVTISEIKSGSPSLCAVADYAQFHLDRRLTWGETKESAVAEIKEIIKDMDATVEVLQYEEQAWTGKKYGMEKYYPTWKIEESEYIVQTAVKAFETLFDKKPKIDKWTFSTNGIAINGMYNIPTIGFGPGNEVLAHAPDEKVPVNDLVVASAFYAGFAYLI